MTPEGRVKSRLKKLLDAHEIYYFLPATGGYGRSGVPDVVGCLQGRFFAIEVKAEGKAEHTTALQKRELARIKGEGGIALIYDGTMSDADVLETILGGEER